MKISIRLGGLARWLLVGLMAVMGAVAHAAPVSCGAKPIRLAFYEFGYFYFTDSPQARGIDKDIVDELVKRSGDLDMSVSGIQNRERDQFAWFAPYLSMKNYVVMPVRAFKHGATQDKWLDELRVLQRVQDSANAETLFKKLKETRIDALFAQPPVYRKYIQDGSLQKDVVVLDWTPTEKGVVHDLILAKSRFTETDARQWKAVGNGAA